MLALILESYRPVKPRPYSTAGLRKLGRRDIPILCINRHWLLQIAMIMEQAILPQHQIVISAGLAGVMSLSLFVEDRSPIVVCLLNHHRK